MNVSTYTKESSEWRWSFAPSKNGNTVSVKLLLPNDNGSLRCAKHELRSVESAVKLKKALLAEGYSLSRFTPNLSRKTWNIYSLKNA